MSLSDIMAGFLAAGLLQLRGLHGFEGWRYLFLIEVGGRNKTCRALKETHHFTQGALTFVVGLLAVGLMPPSPTQTANWFRGEQGWFDERYLAAPPAISSFSKPSC